MTCQKWRFTIYSFCQDLAPVTRLTTFLAEGSAWMSCAQPWQTFGVPSPSNLNPGKGTSFTIRLPLTLSITKALSCINNQGRIAFPMDGVEDMLDAPKDRIQTNEQGANLHSLARLRCYPSGLSRNC
jgi:hypothetical protein